VFDENKGGVRKKRTRDNRDGSQKQRVGRCQKGLKKIKISAVLKGKWASNFKGVMTWIILSKEGHGNIRGTKKKVKGLKPMTHSDIQPKGQRAIDGESRSSSS